MDPNNREYSQCHAPVRKQEKAVGHCVRAVYMYMAMADLALEMKDPSLFDACHRLWENIVNRRMYITGGIGSTVDGEAFTEDYDLPNDSVYAETCASIAMVMFAKRMLEIEADGNYADIMERELYNGILSGMQLDGKAFFYVNPLETVSGISGEKHGFRHVLVKRPKWYACACCPPNIVRLMTSLGTYAWSEKENTIYSHFYLGQEAQFKKAKIQIESKYPWEGDILYRVFPKTEELFTLAVHIPSHIDQMTVELNGEEIEYREKMEKGYLYLERVWSEGDQIQIRFKIEAKRIYADPRVRADAGCVAVMRGPIVYCFETVDQVGPLSSYQLPVKAQFEEVRCQDGPLKNMVLLKVNAKKLEKQDALYMECAPVKEEIILTAIPYFAWGNRMEGDMRVWMQEESGTPLYEAISKSIGGR